MWKKQTGNQHLNFSELLKTFLAFTRIRNAKKCLSGKMILNGRKPFLQTHLVDRKLYKLLQISSIPVLTSLITECNEMGFQMINDKVSTLFPRQTGK